MQKYPIRHMSPIVFSRYLLCPVVVDASVITQSRGVVPETSVAPSAITGEIAELPALQKKPASQVDVTVGAAQD